MMPGAQHRQGRPLLLRVIVCVPIMVTLLAAHAGDDEASLAQAPATASSTPGVRCPTATLTNEDPDLREDLRTAMADACAILESDLFRVAVEESRLARKCPGPFKKHKLLDGREIYRKLAEGLPTSFTATAEKVGGEDTVASTSAGNRSMSIEPFKFTDWRGGSQKKRAETINTLIHEMTHLVETTPGSWVSFFQDGWEWSPWCNGELLVSYSLGDIAETQWLASHP